MQLLSSSTDNGWKDIALGDLDGDGDAEPRGCLGNDCQVEITDLDGDGKDELILITDQVTVEGWGQTITIDRKGQVSTLDVDGDGIEELLIREDNDEYIWVYRGIRGGLAPEYGIRIEHGHDGIPQFADLNDDGINETLLRSSEGGLHLSPLSSSN
jgi:hypothetical protein